MMLAVSLLIIATLNPADGVSSVESDIAKLQNDVAYLAKIQEKLETQNQQLADVLSRFLVAVSFYFTI